MTAASKSTRPEREAPERPPRSAGPRTGRVIGGVVGGRYRLEARLAQGTGGIVYRARHVETGGAVALKFLKASSVNQLAASRRFVEEARHTHGLRHPNTVRLYDFGKTTDGTPFLAMEYLEGRTLAEVMESEGRMAPARAIHIVMQVLRSLGEAHAASLVHRDVKPSNVMLLDMYDEPDFVKVLDFGVARVLAGEANPNTGPAGSPICMAPEQWTGAPIDRRTDLYAVGCLLYQLIAGRPPYDIAGAGKRQIVRYMLAHLHSLPTPLDEAAPGVCSPPLADLVHQLLLKDPSHRPDNAGVVLDRLEEVQSAFDLRAPPPAPGRRATRTTPPSHRPLVEPSYGGGESVSAMTPSSSSRGAPAAAPVGRSSSTPPQGDDAESASGAEGVRPAGQPSGASSHEPALRGEDTPVAPTGTRPRTGRRRRTPNALRPPPVESETGPRRRLAHAPCLAVQDDRAALRYGLIALLLAVIFGVYVYLGMDLFFGEPAQSSYGEFGGLDPAAESSRTAVRAPTPRP